MVIDRIICESKEDWLKIRGKYFTSSEINRLLTNVKRPMTDAELEARPKGSKATTIEDPTILSDGAITYILEKICDLEAVPHYEKFTSYEMKWGNENEPQAVMRLCWDYGLDINSDDVIYTSEGGFVFYFSSIGFGGTPDMVIYNENRNVEIKCPNSATHLYYKKFLTAENFQSKLPIYYDQMQTNMILTNCAETIFMSYDPAFKKESLQTHYLTIKADKARQQHIVDKVALAVKYKEALLCH